MGTWTAGGIFASIATAAVSLPACFDPVLPQVSCGAAGQCPPGLTCDEATNTCGGPATGFADASRIDALAPVDANPADAAVSALVDRGLLARYFLDEAASGQEPVLAEDSAPDPRDLEIAYAPALRYAEMVGHRGLLWTVAGENGGAGATINGSKFQGLTGLTAATIELVIEIEDVSLQGSMILSIGSQADPDVLTLGSHDPGNVDFIANGKVIGSYPAEIDKRTVLHAVYDSQQDVGQRRRMFLDGVELTSNGGNELLAGEPLDIEGTDLFVLGNRLAGGRSFAGLLYYAALYDLALTGAEIEANAVQLLADDDAP